MMVYHHIASHVRSYIWLIGKYDTQGKEGEITKEEMVKGERKDLVEEASWLKK